MDTISQLTPKISRLKLSGILSNLDLRINEAQEHKRSYSEFLLSLFQDEVERRDSQAIARRIRRGNLSPGKTLEAFNFEEDPKLSVPMIRELASCRFIENRENVILIGLTGNGKTHIAQALGHEAARRGYDLFQERVSKIISDLGACRGDGTFSKRMRFLCTVPLLILDDFGLTELSSKEQMDLYEIICGRYEHASTIITSNRDVSEWLGVFENPLLGAAAVDRLSHRAIRLVFNGPSYRTREAVKLNNRYANLTVEKSEN